VSGLQTSSTASSYSITATASTGAISVSSNSIPTHPYGSFPTNASTQSVAILNVNGNSVVPYSFSFNATPAKTSTNSGNYPMSVSVIGIWWDNAPLFASTDNSGINPFSQESGDVFMGHPNPSAYHHHLCPPMIYNWIADQRLQVVALLLDGYPLVRPFLIYDNLLKTTRLIQTSDLNINHGLTGSFTYTLSNVSVTVNFIYVATYDFPYTVSSFYGTPATLSTS